MSLRGTIRDGKVEFEGGTNLPEGTPVEVRQVESETLLDKLLRHSVADPSLPKDYASELDHYLYGHPKRNGRVSKSRSASDGKRGKKSPATRGGRKAKER